MTAIKKIIYPVLLALLSITLVSCRVKTKMIDDNDVKVNDKLKDMLIKKYIYAYNYHLNKESFNVTTTANINNAIVGKQEALTIKTKLKDRLYQYTATYGKMEKIQTFFQLSGNKTKLSLKSGKVNEYLKPIKSLELSTTNYDKNKKDKGISTDELNHIVNNDTVVDIYNYELVDDLEKFTVVLDPLSINENYKLNISATNPYKTTGIEFKYVSLDVTLDEKGYFKEINYTENYKISVVYIIPTTQEISANLLDRFEYQESNIKIEEY